MSAPSRLLLTGRAGSGKTHALVDRLESLARAGKLDGALALLPTQSQVDHLRGVLLGRDLPGFVDDFAHTFFTFARSLTGAAPEQLLSEPAREYLLGEVLRLETLPSFARVRDTRGFRSSLSAAIRELKQNGILPGRYEELVLGPLAPGAGAHERHRDLGKALTAYQKRVADGGWLDQEDLELQALRRLAAEPALLSGKKLLLVDGFHDFTPVQHELLERLAGRVPESIFTLSFDAARHDNVIFQSARRTRARLLSIGFHEQPLAGNRRTEDPTLRRLEEGLFSATEAAVDAGSSLAIVRCARAEDEVESIARRIVRLVREDKVPYRDIAVLYHDLGGVAGLMEGTFRKFGIPLRTYAPRSLHRLPITEFLLDLGGTLSEGPVAERLLRLLRSGYIENLDPAETDRLDHFVREQGPPHEAREWIELCDRLRLASIASVLRRLRAAGEKARGRHSHDFLVSAWLGCFEDLVLPLGEQGPEGPLECAAYRTFRSVLDAARLLHHGKTSLTLGLLVELAREGTVHATFRLPDRRREVVNAIHVREARQWQVPHLFVGGLLERQFPPAPPEDLFLDDEDRRRLNAAGLRFPDREGRIAEERFLFYTALTRARTSLNLSHALSDAQGNPLLASFFMREIARLFTSRSLERRTRARAASEILPPADEIVSPDDIDCAVFLGLAERYPREAPPGGIQLAAALYSGRRADSGFREALRRVLAGINATLAEESRREIGARDVAFSNSALVDFLQCPYLHYARKWCRLRSLPEPMLEPADWGRILHETLKEVYASPDDRDPFAILEEQFQSASRGRAATFRRKAGYWSLKAALGEILAAEKQRKGTLRPALFEVPFGLRQEGSRPALGLLAGGRSEKLSGKIDRVDLDPDGKIGYVVDYKYSDPKSVGESFRSVLDEEMANFQPVLYLLALAEALGLEPAGAELLAVRKGVRRFALGRESLASRWDPPEKSARLSEAAFTALLERAKAAMAALIVAARSGEIGTRPRDLTACGPSACDAADLCRFDRWLGRGGTEGS